MRQVLRKIDGGRRALALGVALTLVGCGGGGGGGGGGSAIAPTTSGVTPITSGQTPGTPANLTAIEMFPKGTIEIFGFQPAGMGTAAGQQAQQIIVMGYYKDGAQRDLTRDVTFKVADSAIAKVSGDGLVTPVAAGTTTITVEQPGAGGQTLTLTRDIKVDTKPVAVAGATSIELYPGPVTRLTDVNPAAAKEQWQQFVVVVRYSDGTSEDVTRKLGLQVIDATNGGPTVAAKASASGLLRAVDNATVDVVADMSALSLVASARLILGSGGNGSPNGFTPYTGAPLAGSTNPIDITVLAALKPTQIEPSKLADDGEFLRRVTADLTGKLPTEAELVAFKADTAANKRAAKVDALLASPEFANHWARNVLGTVFGVNGAQMAAFDTALVTELQNDTKLADIVKALVNGTGALGTNWNAKYPVTSDKVDLLVNAFTGYTSKCAKCHDHPLTTAQDTPRFVQDENYGLYAFFATNPTEATKLNKANQRFGQPVQPSFAFDKTVTGLPTLADPLATRKARFADLFTQSSAFMRGTAHRIWAEMDMELLDPNEFLQANLAQVANPKLLDTLATAFKDQGTSLKGFLRTICNSKTYQLSTAGKSTKNDPLNARKSVRRHHSEVLESGISSNVAGVPFQSDAFFAFNFGYPSTRASITERNDNINLGQAFTLMNSPRATNGKVAMAASATATLAADVTSNKITIDEAIRKLFRSALSRDPSQKELDCFKQDIAAATNVKEGLDDAAVALCASIEYLMR